MPVTGIGGLFFRADDPKALSAWYKNLLGIDPASMTWDQQAGPTILAPFSRSSDYFSTQKHYMLNLRVSDLDAVLAKLQAAGIAITTNPEWDSAGFGRFAHIHDPEDNPIELWEPAAE